MTRSPSRWRSVSVTVVPALGLAGFLIVSWAAGMLYKGIGAYDPYELFGRYWAMFDPVASLSLLITVLAALVVSCLFPTRGPGLERLSAAGGLGRRVGSGPWMVTAMVVLVILIVAKGENLIVADHYLKFRYEGALASVANLVSPVGFIVAGIIAARHRAVGRLLFLAFLVVMFAYGTRLLGVGPLLYIAGVAFAGKRPARWKVVGAGVSSVVLLPIALHSRGLASHGFLPYSADLLRAPAQIYEGGLLELLGNVGFTAPISAYAASSRHIPWDAFVASLDPGLAGGGEWDRWGPVLRAHLYIPYSAIGEWGNAGLVPLFMAFLVWGLAVRLCVQIVAKDSGLVGDALLIGVLGLSALAALYIGQYNTRSVSRILTLIILLAAVAAVRRGLASLARTRAGSFSAPRGSGMRTS